MRRRPRPRPERVFLDDGTYKVTSELFSTPRRFYPIAHTSARIRRDPLWLAGGVTAFATLTTAGYGDLLFISELIVIWTLAIAGGALGAGTAVLQLDAIGHPNALIVGPIWRMRALYQAMRDARGAQENAEMPATLAEAGVEEMVIARSKKTRIRKDKVP